MSTTVNEEKKLSLIDGTEISVRPLKISLLRDFMKKFDEISKVSDDNEKSMDILMECAQIAMKQYMPEIADDITKLEDVLDLPTVYSIVEAASGINLAVGLGNVATN
jgi:inhibitor of KinA sporulation pathway (predicted exonuclease)